MRWVIAVLMLVLVAVSVSASMLVDHWGATAEDAGIVENDLVLDIDDIPAGSKLTVAFSIPELGMRAVRGPYEPRSAHRARVQRELLVPEDAEPGTYVVRMTVTDNHGNRRVRHRFVEIE